MDDGAYMSKKKIIAAPDDHTRQRHTRRCEDPASTVYLIVGLDVQTGRTHHAQLNVRIESDSVLLNSASPLGVVDG